MDAASGTTLTISGAVSGTKNLTVTGSGHVILSASNSYSGTTDVSGKLNLTATGAAGATSQVTVENGGSLIFGTSSTPTSGALNPGATVQLAGGGSIITNGSVETIGTLTLIGLVGTGQLDLTSSTNSGVLLTLSGDGSTWTSILNINSWSDGTNGTLTDEIAASNLTSGELSDITWTNVTYNGVTYGSLTGSVLVGGILTPTITAVPEPSTVFSGLLLLGLMGLTQRKQIGKLGRLFKAV